MMTVSTSSGETPPLTSDSATVWFTTGVSPTALMSSWQRGVYPSRSRRIPKSKTTHDLVLECRSEKARDGHEMNSPCELPSTTKSQGMRTFPPSSADTYTKGWSTLGGGSISPVDRPDLINDGKQNGSMFTHTIFQFIYPLGT